MTKRKQKRRDGGFVRMPKAILRNPNFVMLSPYANKLLLDLCEQYNGSNNGDLCATWSMMKKRGWKSNATLDITKRELLYYGFIVETQQGGLNLPSLYALTWFDIDYVGQGTAYEVKQRATDYKQVKKKFNRSKKKQVRQTDRTNTRSGLAIVR